MLKEKGGKKPMVRKKPAYSLVKLGEWVTFLLPHDMIYTASIVKVISWPRMAAGAPTIVTCQAAGRRKFKEENKTCQLAGFQLRSLRTTQLLLLTCNWPPVTTKKIEKYGLLVEHVPSGKSEESVTIFKDENGYWADNWKSQTYWQTQMSQK